MKRLLIILPLLLSLNLQATKWYISPTGNNTSGDGSIGNPYLTLTTAWSHISSGDTIYCRGGTYAFTNSNTLSNKSGTEGSPIVIMNYPGEKPVFDYAAGAPYTSLRAGFSITNVDYIKIKGIRVTNIPQPAAGLNAMYGMILWSGVSYATFEQLEFDHIGGWGVTIGDTCTNVTFLNCDSHHNADPYTSGGNPAYGWADGFQTGSTTSTDITFQGCRAWSNSDDGWDFRGANGTYTLINCWSFRNGYIPDTWETAGNGVGFKMGGKTAPATTDVLRYVYNCVAFDNRQIAFNLGAAAADRCLGGIFYHCSSFRNYQGFNVNSYTNNATIRNSLSYSDSGGAFYDNDYTVNDHNSFDIPLTLTGGDFVSTDTTGVSGARQADGSLPDIDFLNLVVGSDLKDTGTAVGVTTDAGGTTRGYLPDIGAYEYEQILLPLPNNKMIVVNNKIRIIRK